MQHDSGSGHRPITAANEPLDDPFLSTAVAVSSHAADRVSHRVVNTVSLDSVVDYLQATPMALQFVHARVKFNEISAHRSLDGPATLLLLGETPIVRHCLVKCQFLNTNVLK